MYFSRSSSVWGEATYNDTGSEIFGGLALLSASKGKAKQAIRSIDASKTLLESIIKDDVCLLAGYAITAEQFSDIVKQENKFDPGAPPIPDVLFNELSSDNPSISLSGRTGENAIRLSNGDVLEIDVRGAYSTLLYLGDVTVDGEIAPVITFSSPISYEASAAQAYVNTAIVNVPFAVQERAKELLIERVAEIIGPQESDSLSRLNPASADYVEMITNGIVEIGGGQGDWTKDNALSYVLSKPPFAQGQMPELGSQVGDYLQR